VLVEKHINGIMFCLYSAKLNQFDSQLPIDKAIENV